MRRTLGVGMALIWLAGCAASPATVPLAHHHGCPTVLLFRGFTGHWSHGLNRIADSLREEGIEAAVYPHSDWPQVARALETSNDDRRLILVGHSWGADDAIRLALRLQISGIRVGLLVTLDPVTPPKVPANVDQAINFYESNGIRDILPWWRGVPLSSDRVGTNVLNIDVRHERPDLGAAGVTHANISDSSGIQREILAAIAAITPG